MARNGNTESDIADQKTALPTGVDILKQQNIWHRIELLNMIIKIAKCIWGLRTDRQRKYDDRERRSELLRVTDAASTRTGWMKW